jgi:hypothetical protein
MLEVPMIFPSISIQNTKCHQKITIASNLLGPAINFYTIGARFVVTNHHVHVPVHQNMLTQLNFPNHIIY